MVEIQQWFLYIAKIYYCREGSLLHSEVLAWVTAEKIYAEWELSKVVLTLPLTGVCNEGLTLPYHLRNPFVERFIKVSEPLFIKEPYCTIPFLCIVSQVFFKVFIGLFLSSKVLFKIHLTHFLIAKFNLFLQQCVNRNVQNLNKA